MLLSSKLRRWVDAITGEEGLVYYCQGCESHHRIVTKGICAWAWNGDVEKPVFSPSVLLTTPAYTDVEKEFTEFRIKRRCHTFVGCNGAQPGEVIFLEDCTHKLAGQVLPLPDLPSWSRSQMQKDDDE